MNRLTAPFLETQFSNLCTIIRMTSNHPEETELEIKAVHCLQLIAQNLLLKKYKRKVDLKDDLLDAYYRICNFREDCDEYKKKRITEVLGSLEDAFSCSPFGYEIRETLKRNSQEEWECDVEEELTIPFYQKSSFLYA